MPYTNNTMLSGLKIDIRKHVLGCFLTRDVHEVNDIAALVGVSRQTVMKSLSFFMKEDLIIVSGKGEAKRTGGKKPLIYSLNPSLYLVCITLWGDLLQVALFNMKGDLIDQVRLDIQVPDSAKAAVDNAGRLAVVLLEKNHVEKKDVRGVSVSVPGTVDRKRNTMIYSAPLPQWGFNIPVEEYIRPYFDPETVVFVESPSKIHSGFYFLDNKYLASRMVVISVSKGVSGCLIRNGSILNGSNSLVGEMGHLCVDPHDEEVCGCGSRGCLEVMISMDRLRKIIREQRKDHPESVLSDEDPALDYNKIFRASEAGDPVGRYCSDYLAGHFSIALLNILLIFDPNYVAFVGDYFIADENFTRRIYDHLCRFKYIPDGRRPFEIFFDTGGLIARDAEGSMLALRWKVLNRDEIYNDPEPGEPGAAGPIRGEYATEA